jgi:hypothetical protein
MMLARVVYLHNPFNPSLNRELREVVEPLSILDLAPVTQQPYICIINGQPVLRTEWHVPVKHGDMVAFVVLPQGGGGGASNVLKVVLMVIVMIYAPVLGAQLAGAGATAGTVAAYTAGVQMAGSMIVNALIPPPKPPAPYQSVAQAAPSPTYSIGAQGNSARISQPIPVLYGRHLIYPDFAAEPYTEFAGGDQYLYQLFCVSQGEIDIEQIRIEDTPIASFPEITYEVVPPGGFITMFPTNVLTAAEVSGQELLTGTVSGPFVAAPPGTLAHHLAVDVVCPKGLFYANDAGGLNQMSVTFKVEARRIDDLGAPIAPGTWAVLGTETITGATQTPPRKSYRYTVTPGRYEVKVTRTDIKSNSNQAGHDLVWSALRSYLPGTQQYGEVTMLAMRMKASNALSQSASRRVNLIATRKLRIWDPVNGWSISAVPTRSIAWAIADMARASYGAGMADSRIDLAGMYALDQVHAARGDTFDAVVDQRMGWWDAVSSAAGCGRAKPYMQSGIVRVVRDGSVTLPAALFNTRNIVRGSLKVDYLTPTDATADSVEVEYFNGDKWKPDTVLAQLPGSSRDKRAKVKLFGCTSRARAWREGMYHAAANRYRRKLITFTTEMEGFIPTFGDLIAIAHDRPQWGQSGELLGWDAGTLTLKTSEPLVFTPGETHYIGLRKTDGSFSGPYAATVGADEYHAVIDAPPDFTPYTGTAMEKTFYAFGAGTLFYQKARVTGIRPRGMEKVEISAVNEDDAVHTADTGTTPPVSVQWNLPSVITKPEVSGLNVTLGGNRGNPLLIASWQAGAGADYYLVERSFDGGQSWASVGEPRGAQISFPAVRGTVMLRVAAVGVSIGEWVVYIGDPYKQPPPNVTVFLVGRQPDGTREFTWSITNPPPDLAGVRIRYKLGTGHLWENMTDMAKGLITASPFETNQLAAGTYTFAIKAFDDDGIESSNATYITADLGDPRLAGVLISALPHLQGWSGTLTDCHIDPEENVLSANEIETWADRTTWTGWGRWLGTTLSPIRYEHSVIDLGAPVPFTPLVSAIVNGTMTLEECHSVDGVTWSAWGAPGARVTARYIKVRITVAGTLAQVLALDIKLSAAAVSEEINDCATSALTGAYRIAVGDIRLPIVKSYSLVTQVQIALQNVGAGWSWELVDKDSSVGPRIKIYNASNVLADATIDALIRGA